MNRLCIFAHFDKNNLVEDYVFYYLRALKEISSHIVFVTTSMLGHDSETKLLEVCDFVIARENIGYDFMSWKAGLSSIEKFDDYDEVIICNDSVYGPLYSLEKVFSDMNNKKCDFWGMTCNYEISYHIQSYFVVFRKSTLKSNAFKSFWRSVSIESSKRDVIEKYEVRLTQALMKEGFNPAVYAPTKPSSADLLKNRLIFCLICADFLALAKKIFLSRGAKKQTGLNPTHFYWKNLILKYKMPLLKIELLRDNPMKMDISQYEDVIKRYTNYDLRLIMKHLERVKTDS